MSAGLVDCPAPLCGDQRSTDRIPELFCYALTEAFVQYKKMPSALNLAAKSRTSLILAIFVIAHSAFPQSTARDAGKIAPGTALDGKAGLPAIPADVKAALAGIRASNLKGDLSFLSSDALAGRYTPSPGLEVAAEFIASQFRAAGLKPGGDHDYFQLAAMVDRRLPKLSTPITLQEGSRESTIPVSSIALVEGSSALNLERCPVIIVKEQTPDALKDIQIANKIVLAPSISYESVPEADRESVFSRLRAFESAVKASAAKALILVGRGRTGRPSLLSAEQAEKRSGVPIIAAESEELAKWLANPNAHAERTISLEVPAPDDQKVLLKNVIAVLPGSDPKLKSTYVMLTAHYDHIGTIETGKGMSLATKANGSDSIFNGANDDGSGTVSVIEIARALAGLNPHPKRSIIFMTFFGEERGDIGSSYYGQHPVYPIGKTVADLNLEQVGRTDSTEGKKINNVSVTGYDYSEVTKYLEKAGRLTGIKVYMEKPASDDYFVRSDNAALAEQGVPAHTLCVAFDYADYHGLGDEWPKIDYDNMARVDRMVALALINLANSPVAPKWNSNNAKTDPFREAQTNGKP